MADRSPARWLAPLALLAAAVALVVIFTGSLSSEDTTQPLTVTSSTATKPRKKPSRPATSPSAQQTAATEAAGATGVTGAGTYRVAAGDYLSTIAEKTGVPVERLRELNPELDANSMTVGQEIKLKP